jgi:hypothetical protein
MKNIKLSNDEIRAIDTFLWANPCRSGCAYSEMQNSKKDCDECKLMKSRKSVLEKLELL